MPLTSRRPVFAMSPELIQKLEAASKKIEPDADQPQDMPENIVCALQKTLESAAEIVLVDEKRLNQPSETDISLESPRPELADSAESDDNVDEQTRLSPSGELRNADVDDNAGLFEVSVDISEPSEQSDSDDSSSSYSGEFKRNSLTMPNFPDRRRSSRWSATVLFLASEVQMMVNLAQLSPPEGYEMAPKRVSLDFSSYLNFYSCYELFEVYHVCTFSVHMPM